MFLIYKAFLGSEVNALLVSVPESIKNLAITTSVQIGKPNTLIPLEQLL